MNATPDVYLSSSQLDELEGCEDYDAVPILPYAARWGNLDVVRGLLSEGIDPNQSDSVQYRLSFLFAKNPLMILAKQFVSFLFLVSFSISSLEEQQSCMLQCVVMEERRLSKNW